MGIEDVIRARARMPSAPDLPPSYDSIVPQTCRPQQQNYGNTASSQELVLVPRQSPPQYSTVFHSSQPIILPGQPVSQQQIIYTQPQPMLILPGQPMSAMEYVNYQPTLGAAPIVIQPGAPQLRRHFTTLSRLGKLLGEMRWMAVLAPVPGCPPGLEPLRGLKKITLRQKHELVEYDLIYAVKRYAIENQRGEHVFLATGKPEPATGWGPIRGHRIIVLDAYNRIPFTITCPFREDRLSCCASLDCCKQQTTVRGSGETFGTIRTGQACCATKLTIADRQGKKIINIDGSPCLNRCCFDVDYPLISATDYSTLGQITRKYRADGDSCRPDSCSARDRGHEMFEIEFPSDLSVRTKATIIGACIMIDFLDFESTKTRSAH
ncbi:hypothetical protein PRIPAC_83336 [Pristionchus pacificus]|uniref:Phospholipid scramblase n=1 Tax=Pristionchus pacificus TaxID=54126 RepID=A0A2A6BS83_PRIPA|nr:hypothetical protein PRIPAC_83336 [Pristionchus pacificus]|eukprot:PDM68621.1 hypothetical protein PRIPAC_46923 [Pristionchus pacificus]